MGWMEGVNQKRAQAGITPRTAPVWWLAASWWLPDSSQALSWWLSGFQEIIRGDSGCPQDRSQRPLRQIAWVVRDGCVSVGIRVEPDFMTARSLTKKLKAKRFEFLDNDTIAKTG